MVVSEDSQGVTVDCSVGSIVWVRRRNGSWWPGKILGPNELSASHLMSPRSGTPVKLLGREDASVAPFYECLCICRVEFILSPLRDWYNLEKSKRVKAFRCGEFDDCIGRAESSQGIPIKKREKYARREDAILHALELERQQLEQKQVKLGMAANCIGDTMIGVSRKQFPSENSLGKDDTRDQNYKFINLKSQTLSKRLDSSFEEDSNPSHNQKIKKANKLGWEDDNAEAIPRMRGLQDFGLKIAPSKGRLSASIVCESSCKSVLVENQVSSGKNSLAAKRKRSHGGPTEESLVKRRDRRRPLLQVLQSSPKLLACQALQSDRDAVSNSMREEEHMGVLCGAKGAKILSYALPNDLEMDISQSQFGLENRALHPVSLTEENACSSLIEEEESDSLEGDFLNLDSEEEGAMLSGSRNSESFAGCNSFGFRAQGKLVNIGNEGLDECGFSNYMPHFHHLERSGGVSADASVSKWQLKGKRNIRYLTKKPTELMDGNKCNGSRHKASWEVKRTAIKTMRTGISSQWPSGQGFPHKNVNELNYAYDQGDMSEKDFAETDRVGFGSRRYQLMPNSYFRDRGRNSDRVMDSVDNSCAISLSEMNRFSNLPSSLNSEGCWLSQASLSGYWEESDRGFDPLKLYGYREADPSWEGNLMESMLVDVDLKVQATYQGERVPLVSLMSRLNGKAIVGHPVHIEVLDDGATDLLLSSNDCHEGPTDKSGSSGLPPIWCTARRTAMPRVPRVQPSSPPEDEVWEPNQRAVIENSRPPSKKPYANYFNHRLRLVKNSFSHIHRPMMEKLSRKILKKVSLSKKTRMLSSIAIDQKPSGKSGNSMLGSKNSCDSDVLVKNEITPIMCVSVKLVFSRILEALGEPQPKPS